MFYRYVEFILHTNQEHARADLSNDLGQVQWFSMLQHLIKSLNQLLQGIEKTMAPALLKVCCLPVHPTVQLAGSKWRPPVNRHDVSTSICERAHTQEHSLPARAHTHLSTHAHSRARTLARALSRSYQHS
jgi:hypothetical protein